MTFEREGPKLLEMPVAEHLCCVSIYTIFIFYYELGFLDLFLLS